MSYFQPDVWSVSPKSDVEETRVWTEKITIIFAANIEHKKQNMFST